MRIDLSSFSMPQVPTGLPWVALALGPLQSYCVQISGQIWSLVPSKVSSKELDAMCGVSRQENDGKWLRLGGPHAHRHTQATLFLPGMWKAVCHCRLSGLSNSKRCCCPSSSGCVKSSYDRSLTQKCGKMCKGKTAWCNFLILDFQDIKIDSCELGNLQNICLQNNAILCRPAGHSPVCGANAKGACTELWRLPANCALAEAPWRRLSIASLWVMCAPQEFHTTSGTE